MKKKRVLWKFILGLFLVIGAGGQKPMDMVDVACVLIGLGLVGWGVSGLIPKREKSAAPAQESAPQTSQDDDADYPFSSLQDSAALKLRDYVILDVETTGFSPRDDKIIEVGALKVKNGAAASFSTLVNPGRRIPKKTTDVHGITDADVAEAPSFDQIAGDLLAFMEGLPVVGHNVMFDLRFLAWGLHDSGRDVPAMRYVDTYRLSKKAFPGRASYALASLIQDHQLAPGEQEHRSESDAQATLALYRLCCEKLKK